MLSNQVHSHWRVNKDMRRFIKNLEKLGLKIVESKLGILELGAITIDRLQRGVDGDKELMVLCHMIVIVNPTWVNFLPHHAKHLHTY